MHKLIKQFTICCLCIVKTQNSLFPLFKPFENHICCMFLCILRVKNLITEHKQPLGLCSHTTWCLLSVIPSDLTPLKRFMACSFYLYLFWTVKLFSWKKGQVPLLLLSNIVSPWDLAPCRIFSRLPWNLSSSGVWRKFICVSIVDHKWWWSVICNDEMKWRYDGFWLTYLKQTAGLRAWCFYWICVTMITVTSVWATWTIRTSEHVCIST